jgi:hypothetical protein
MGKINKKNKMYKANILLENRYISEKIGEESLVNDLTNKVKELTLRVNNGENLESELQNSISKLILALKDNSIDENKIVEGVFDYAKIALISGLMALGMSNAQAQTKINNAINTSSVNISSVNKSAEVELSSKIKIDILKTINGYLNQNKDVDKIVIEIVGKASQVTAPAGMSNEELAIKRAENAKSYIEDKYGDKVVVSNITTEIGSTKYIRGVDTGSDDKFTKEQGVSINLIAKFGGNLFGSFKSIVISPGMNPDNLLVYNRKGELITSTGFFGDGNKYHPHYLVSTTMSIVKDKKLGNNTKLFKGTLDELKTLLTQPLADNDTYYNNALKILIDRYNNNKPIYLYDLHTPKTLDLSDLGFVTIKVVTSDKDTEGSIIINGSNNQKIKGVYNKKGFSFYNF